MNSYQSVWEDDETNRKVELVVNYSLGAAGIAISNITPTKVTFLCPDTKSELRSIGVWTNGGRDHLVRKFHDSGRVSELEQEIAGNHSLGTSA